MAIKSSAFGPTVLSGDDADRFLQHISEDAPNPRAIQAYKRGKAVLAKVLAAGKIPRSSGRNDK